MKQVKKLLSLVLVFALLLSLTTASAFAIVRSNFSIELEATSDYEGSNAITSTKEGETFYIRIKFNGNTEENNIANFNLYISYDKSLISVDSNQIYGEGPCTNITSSVDARGDGIVALAWADNNGFKEGTGPNRRTPESGTIAVITCVAKEELSKSDVASFAVVDNEELDTLFDSVNNEEVTTAISNLALPVLAENSILVYSEDETTVAAPTLASSNVTVSFKAITADETGSVADETNNASWSVDDSHNGVTVDKGAVTVTSAAGSGTYSIKAQVGDKTGSATLTVTKEASVASSIEFDGTTPADPYIVPADGAPDVTEEFSVKVLDQYGVEIKNPTVTWELNPSNVQGVSLSNNGKLTITNAAKTSIGTDGTTFTIKASCGGLNPVTTEVTVQRAKSDYASIEILKNGNAIATDNIEAGKTGNYTAQHYDQYGYTIDPPPGETPNWSIDEVVGCSSNLITLAPSGQDAYVTVDAAVQNGASAKLSVIGENELSDSITITVAAFETKGTVTVAEKPTYGMTWNQIIDTTGLKVYLGNTEINGTFTVKGTGDGADDNIPNAGDAVGYQVLFTSKDETYKNIVAASGSVKIDPKPVTVTGITVADKVYDGGNSATLSYEGVNFVGKVDGDSLTIDSATGTFSDENAGENKTVNITGITLGGDDAANYTLSTPVTATGNITKKELTANVSGVTVTKEYDGTTAPGTVTGSATADTGIIGETVTVKVSAGEYADKNVGNDKSVTLTLSLSGDNASNYTLSNTTVEIYNAEITAKDVTKSEDFAQNVVVGVGTFTAPKFTGIGGEEVTGTVTYSYDGKTSYDEIVNALKSLSEGQTATINYTFTADGNYSGEITGTITVTMVDIVFTVGTETATADNAVTIKEAPTYGDDWSEIVTIKENDIVASLNGETLTGGAYSLNVSGMPTASEQSYTVQYTYGDKTYNVCTGTVTVAQKELTITGLSVEDKEYDGNTDAIVTGTATLEGVLDGDQVAVVDGTASFVNKNVGTEKAVTFSGYSLNGQDAGNYKLSAQPSVTATINPKPVTITGVTAEDKTYDGKTTATIANLGTINGIISGETVTIKAGTGTFASADVGTGITVTFSGFSLTGTDSGNYTLSAQPADTTADIAKGTYTGTPNTVNVNILINQSAAQTGSVSLDQFFQTIPAGAVITSVAPASGSVMASVSVADGVISYSSKANLETEGVTDAYSVTIETKNYNNITATLTFTTVAKTPVNISGVSVTGAGKTYDGKAVSYTGTPAAKTNDGKTVTVTGTYSYVWQKAADGTGLASAPKDAGSYKLVITLDDPAYIGSAEVSFTIAKAKITITAEDAEAYTGSDMPKLSYTVTGLASGESLAVEPTLSCAADMKKAASYEIKVSGAAVPDTANYVEAITYVSGVLTVKDRPINIGPVYDITVLESDHGTVKASLSNASEGSTIRLTVTPDEGYSLYSITVRAENGKLIDVSKSGGVYSFKMPASAVTVQASFVKGTMKLPFNDVSTYDWFYDAVMYAYSNGIMNGLDTNVFGPNETTTRAMLVTMIYRAVGEPAVSGSNTFRDVAANTWYTDAIIWASTNCIVTGVDDGLFNPNGAITREQLATILYRYAKYVGDDVSASASLAGFTDAGSISDYAKDAMSWAVAAGLFEGRDNGKLEPTGTATRAEIATVFMRHFG